MIYLSMNYLSVRLVEQADCLNKSKRMSAIPLDQRNENEKEIFIEQFDGCQIRKLSLMLSLVLGLLMRDMPSQSGITNLMFAG